MSQAERGLEHHHGGDVLGGLDGQGGQLGHKGAPRWAGILPRGSPQGLLPPPPNAASAPPPTADEIQTARFPAECTPMPGNPNPSSPPRTTAIAGALVQDLGWFTDQRGSLSVLLRGDQDALGGERFGQAYVTTVLPGVVKAWHRHTAQTDRMVGLVGRTLLVLMDGREDSATRGEVVEVVLGERHPVLVLIPPGVWHGLKSIGGTESMVLNLPDTAYDEATPDEERAPAHGQPGPGVPAYDWSRRDA